ncbi:MAG TPA: HlyD family efflux transporter periplasmic adaptor subunit [Patescibacteria group bacterium]|nr:HlyD family efflux transporter periplasmic adaptor subunit [Patescibacteria group bacterium]
MEQTKQTKDQVVEAVAGAEDKVEKTERSLLKNKWFQSAGWIVLVAAIAGGLLYWQSSSTRVKIDDSLISAPVIELSPTAGGQLQEVYVNEGDTVAANTPVAKVGDEIIKTKTAGLIVNTQKDIGKSFNPGQAVVGMVDPGELRVVGTIDENKGLDKIRVGQLASFTVDAFGSKKYYGVVDEVSPTSHQTDVVFNISDNRPTQQFDIKVRFDPSQYPELKNGMSAKITIFVK